MKLSFVNILNLIVKCQHDVPLTFFFRRSHFIMIVFGWSSLAGFLVANTASMLLEVPPYYYDLVIEVWILLGTAVILSVDLFTLIYLLGGDRETGIGYINFFCVS